MEPNIKPPEQKSFVNRHPIFMIFFVFIVLLVFIALFGGGGNSSSNNATPQPQAAQQQSPLQVCLSLAQQNYSDNWDSQCKTLGEAANCKLNVDMAQLLDNRLEGDKNDCYHQFPQ